MTRPTDAAVARAFYEAKAHFEPVAPNYLISYQAVIDRAIEIDAADKTAAPYDRCPTCTAHMPVGKTCGGVNCGLKPA